jgi:phage gp45-like
MDKAANFWRCIDNGTVVGMVTTNSNAYIAGPPVFADGVLSYKVSSPHYDPLGNVQIGTYDLAIRSDVARCIYGFTSAPIQASISIVYDDGQSKSATTVVSERNNWLRLSAKGFTYSSPTLKVSLTQEGRAIEATEVAPLSLNKAKKSTIICVKGTLIKKVNAVKPKCPNGYKRKK